MQITGFTQESTTILPHEHKPSYCQYGLRNQCEVNEECYIPETSHSRTGICVCVEGFEHNENYTCVNVSLGIHKEEYVVASAYHNIYYHILNFNCGKICLSHLALLIVNHSSEKLLRRYTLSYLFEGT